MIVHIILQIKQRFLKINYKLFLPIKKNGKDREKIQLPMDGICSLEINKLMLRNSKSVRCLFRMDNFCNFMKITDMINYSFGVKRV